MSHDADIRGQVNRGVAWIGLASALVGVLDLVSVVLVLALWLTPFEYGVAMLAGSLFQVLDLATDLGLSSAVIQRDDHTRERISTVFWLNLALSIAILGALVAVAPLLGELQSAPVVGTILIAYGGKLVFHNTYFIPQALMKKQLRFKELSMIRIAANLAEFAGKLIAAGLGAGVWFHLIGRLCHTAVTALGIQLRNPWWPRLQLSLRESRSYLAFGIKTSASQILFHLYTNLDYQVVGYYFGAAANGFYHLAYTLVLEPVRMVSFIAVDIAFPAYARLKHQRDRLYEQLVSFTRLNLIAVLPILVVIALAADDLVRLFWGPQWLPAVAPARILCAVGVLRALSFVLPPLLDGVGRPGLTLAYTATAAALVTGCFFAFAELLGERYGFSSVALAWVAGYPVAFALLAWLTLAELGVSMRHYLRRIGGTLACIAASAAVGELVRLALTNAPTVARFAGFVVAMLVTLVATLARFEQITLRSLRAALADR